MADYDDSLMLSGSGKLFVTQPTASVRSNVAGLWGRRVARAYNRTAASRTHGGQWQALFVASTLPTAAAGLLAANGTARACREPGGATAGPLWCVALCFCATRVLHGALGVLHECYQQTATVSGPA